MMIPKSPRPSRVGYGFTATKLREKKGSYMTAFPELERLFEDLLAYAEEQGVIPEG